MRLIILRALGDYGLVQIPPYCDQNGRRIVIIKVCNWQPDIMPIKDLFKASYAGLELASLEPQTQVLGVTGIVDVSGLKVSHIWHITPSMPQKVIQMLIVSESIMFLTLNFCLKKNIL